MPQLQFKRLFIRAEAEHVNLLTLGEFLEQCLATIGELHRVTMLVGVGAKLCNRNFFFGSNFEPLF